MVTPVAVGLAPVPIVLTNGVRVLAVRTRMTPAVTINVALRAGSMYDPEAAPGAAFLLSRTIDRGTTAQSAEAISEDLDSRGVSLRVALTRQALNVSCVCLVEDFEVILCLLADIIQSPTLPEAEIMTRRGEVLTAIQQDDDNPGVTAVERLMTLLYGVDHPFGRGTKGTTESVKQIDRTVLSQLHRMRYVSAGLSVVVVGDVEPSKALDDVSKAFGDWRAEPATETTLAAPPTAAERQRLVVPMMNKSQADIAYGFTTIVRGDPAYYAYWLMCNIFGQYGMGGRLGSSIRERQGMAYYAFCGFEAGLIEGPLIVRAGVSAANVDRAVASIDSEVAALAREGVTGDELDNSKRYLIGSLPRKLETNAGIAAFLQNAQQFDLGLDYDRRLPTLLGEVTPDAVNAAARRTLNADCAAVVVAGPYEDTSADDRGLF
jgi:zinc protease